MKNASMSVEKIIVCNIILSYNNFRGRIIIHTSARKMQIGRIISGK